MALFSFGKKDKNPPEAPASVAKAPPTPPKIQTPPVAGSAPSVPSVKPPQPAGLIPASGMPSTRAATTQPMVMPRPGTTGLKPARPGVAQSTRSTQRIVLPPATPNTKPSNTKPLSMASAPTGRVNLPIGMILRCLPPEVLAGDLSEFEASGAAATEIGLPMNMILSQLPSGKVEIALQDLVPHFPSGYLQPTESIASYLPTLVNLPLMDVVMRIPPDLLSIRPDQKDVDAAVINMADPFTEEILREQAEAARQQAAAKANIIEENQVPPTEEFVPQAPAVKSFVPPVRPQTMALPQPPQRPTSPPAPTQPAPVAAPVAAPIPPMPTAHPLPTPSSVRSAAPAPPTAPSSTRTISPSGRLPVPSRATTPIPTRPPTTPAIPSTSTVPMPTSARPTGSVQLPPPPVATAPSPIPPQPPISVTPAPLPPPPTAPRASAVLPLAPPPPEGFSRRGPTAPVHVPPMPPPMMAPPSVPVPPPQPVVAPEVPSAPVAVAPEPEPAPTPVVSPGKPDAGADDLARLASLAMQQMGEESVEEPQTEAAPQAQAPTAALPPVIDEPAPVAPPAAAPIPAPVSAAPVETPKPVAQAEPAPAKAPAVPPSVIEPPKAAAQPEPEPAPSADVALNINTCTAEALTHIPGCSRELAAAIVNYRTKIKDFKRIEDLLEVPGMTKTAYTNLTGELPPSGEVPQTLNELLGFPPEMTITLKDVTDRIACWPDVTGCVLSQSSGLALVGTVPAGLDKSAIVAFVPRMFESINKSFGEITGKDTDELIIPTTGTSFNILRNKDLFLIIMSRMPLMPERHLKVARFVLAGLSVRPN